MITEALRSAFITRILEASTTLDITVTEQQSAALIGYLELLIKWNKAYNLTAIRDPEEMFTKHILDSLSITKYITGNTILDVGTGPGLPGIPMAIMFPKKHFSLLDSNGKKTRFLVQAQLSLALANVEIFNVRVENLPDNKVFDQIMSRAFTALDNMVNLCKHLLTEKGQFLAMKGLVPEEEIQKLDANFQVKNIASLTVPGCFEQRHLITIEKTHKA